MLRSVEFSCAAAGEELNSRLPEYGYGPLWRYRDYVGVCYHNRESDGKGNWQRIQDFAYMQGIMDLRY